MHQGSGFFNVINVLRISGPTGVVEGISWGIEQQAGEVERGGLPNVTPTVDWVRLAQRFPVSVKFVDVPPEVELRVGMNGNVRIDTTKDTQ